MYLPKAESLKESSHGELFFDRAVQATEGCGPRSDQCGEDGRKGPSPWSPGVWKGFVGLKCKNPSVKGQGMGSHRDGK